MKYIIKARKIRLVDSCDKFCFMKCDRVGKCQAKQR